MTAGDLFADRLAIRKRGSECLDRISILLPLLLLLLLLSFAARLARAQIGNCAFVQSILISSYPR